MKKNKTEQKKIYIYADWEKLKGPTLMGLLSASSVRGKEVFSFKYDSEWLKSEFSVALDPNLHFFKGPQYPQVDNTNFGLFTDSSPDRWGRVLMRRREEQQAKVQRRASKTLMESDYLLGVFDGHRMGALRFKLDPNGIFLDSNQEMASPPWAQLRDLENASLQLEKDSAENQKDYMKWLMLLVAPGGSLGGARPKASVIDPKEDLWIAKFPSANDEFDVGGWEYTTHELAKMAKIEVSPAQLKRFTSKHHTFLTKRFDRRKGKRIHFASAMTLLNRKDGDQAESGASYLDLADFIIKNGAQAEKELKELWRRIVFNVLVSNTDDHLRNHGFILTSKGWLLAPAFDINPSESGNGLTLNISKDDNSQNLELVMDVSPCFRLKPQEAKKILNEVVTAVRKWKTVASKYVLAKEFSRMEQAFRILKTYKG